MLIAPPPLSVVFCRGYRGRHVVAAAQLQRPDGHAVPKQLGQEEDGRAD